MTLQFLGVVLSGWIVILATALIFGLLAFVASQWDRVTKDVDEDDHFTARRRYTVVNIRERRQVWK